MTFSEITPVAIVSDIHGNIEALDAVLKDIKNQDIARIVCLGDIVGYGPDPLKCMIRAMEFELNIAGNHDVAVYDAQTLAMFGELAATSVVWTQAQIRRSGLRSVYERFLRSLPSEHVLETNCSKILLYHGSPFDTLNEYVFPPSKTYWQQLGKSLPTNAMEITARILREMQTPCVVGHTHHPGVITDGPIFASPQEVDFKYTLAGKAIINPGSVGQPRDQNPDASYLVLYGNTVTFRRVPYDITQTRRKILNASIYEETSNPTYMCNRLEVGQ